MERGRIGSARAVAHPSIRRPPTSILARRSAAHARPRAGFTLIELLAVMLIGVLLISLGYAGYNEMRKTTGVGTAARNVADALNLARQAAVASGHRTRFRISIGGGYGDTHYQYGVLREMPSVRVYGSPVWQTVSEWQGLPVGVVFSGSLPPTTNSITGLSGYDNRGVYTNATTYYTNRFYAAVNTSAYTIEFSREGRPSQTWTVTVARGYYTGSGSIPFATSGVDYASVILDSQTGKARVVRK